MCQRSKQIPDHCQFGGCICRSLYPILCQWGHDMILGEIDSNRRFGIGNPVKKAARAELRHVRSSDADELARLLSTTFEAAYKDVHSPENIHAYCESNYSVDEVSQLNFQYLLNYMGYY
jgi:hypothetical protein